MKKLTSQQIQRFPAGDKLDNLIAEHVLGWVHNDDFPEYLDPPYPSARVDTPKCSTDILSAWEVTDKMRDGGYYMELRYLPKGAKEPGKCSVEFFKFHGRILIQYKVYADTVPLAICRAALMAILESA